jgi:hypothetical protein
MKKSRRLELKLSKLRQKSLLKISKLWIKRSAKMKKSKGKAEN